MEFETCIISSGICFESLFWSESAASNAAGGPVSPRSEQKRTSKRPDEGHPEMDTTSTTITYLTLQTHDRCWCCSCPRRSMPAADGTPRPRNAATDGFIGNLSHALIGNGKKGGVKHSDHATSNKFVSRHITEGAQGPPGVSWCSRVMSWLPSRFRRS